MSQLCEEVVGQATAASDDVMSELDECVVTRSRGLYRWHPDGGYSTNLGYFLMRSLSSQGGELGE
jgi:hypothetical protein